MSDYLAYQEKYRDTPRDSDRELIRLVSARTPQGGRVLDVGCSTGNLLRHLHAERPDLSIYGCDVDPISVSTSRKFFPSFLGDVTDSGQWQRPTVPDVRDDAVILNAVLYCLDDAQAAAALRNIHQILKPGGHLFVWDLLHRWEQRLTITEESARYGTPTIHIRPWKLLARMARIAGFGPWCEIRPQKQPQLQKPRDPTDLTSWTQDGISFRGGVAQPWCHAILTK